MFRQLTALFITFLTTLPSPAAPPDNLLFQASSAEPAAAKLINPEITHAVDRKGTATFDIAPDRDAYSKVTWDFRFEGPLFSESEKVFLEVEFFDDNGGVIQPTLLTNDAFKGAYTAPLRAVSFTRLNQQRVRTALFEFVNPKQASGKVVLVP